MGHWLAKRREYVDLRTIPDEGITPEEALARTEDEDFLYGLFDGVMPAEEQLLRARLGIPIKT